MNFKKTLLQAFEVAKLNHPAMHAVYKDCSATRIAVLIIFLSSLAGAMGSLLFPVKYGPVVYRPTVFEALSHALVAFFLILGSIYLLHFVANRFFKAHGTFDGLLRVIGHGYIIGFLNIFPVLALVVFLWMMVFIVKTLIEIKKLTAEKAIMALIVAVVVVFVFLTIFQDLNADNLYGGLYVIPN